MPQPDWTAIFTLHPELDPPGYAATVIDMAENPRRERPKCGKSRSKAKPAQWTPIKHQSPDP